MRELSASSCSPCSKASSRFAICAKGRVEKKPRVGLLVRRWVVQRCSGDCGPIVPDAPPGCSCTPAST